jgi:hypothetical protein
LTCPHTRHSIGAPTISYSDAAYSRPELLHSGQVYHPLPIDAESDSFGGVVVVGHLELREVMLVELVNRARFGQLELLMAVGDQLLEGVVLLLDALAFFALCGTPQHIAAVVAKRQRHNRAGAQVAERRHGVQIAALLLARSLTQVDHPARCAVGV